MQIRSLTGAALALLLTCTLVACSDPEGVGAPTSDEPGITAPATETTEPEPTGTEPTGPAETTAEAAVEPVATGPQTCGTVISTIGQEVTVEIVVGDVDCAFAEDLLDTYYNDPPSPPEGSGGYLTIGDWECNSSSSQEPGRASTCHGPEDGEIVAVPADGAGAGGTPGPVCSQIDQPTLDQIFPDGRYDEELCQSYIDGENSIG